MVRYAQLSKPKRVYPYKTFKRSLVLLNDI